jgi:2-C-methyl-D-erythritol 4-phosphate cytidylyltransferase/2-C-methyl-D-erythritol 2,4-cyclodiphosphate synthase
LPKQYVSLNGVTVFRRTLDVFVASRCAGLVQAVIHADDGEAFSAAAAGLGSAVLSPVTGGATRQASVLAGLRALVPHRPDLVLVHDAARPFVDADVIDRVVVALSGYDGVVPGLALADTLKSVGPDGVVARTIPRDGLWRAQTPQGFRFGALLAAHTAAEGRGRDDFTDDAALAEDAGLRVGVVEGSARNRKLTTAEDLDVAEDELSRAERWPDVRTGTGFDVHRFAEGDHVWLGGVRIAHTHRLDGHSDADVVLHALTDALLGAIGDGDIGQHFPPSDPQWKGAASRIFLEDAVRRVGARGGRISNVDMTVLCEAPRIGPHRDAMRETIAGLLGIAIDRVGVKATTTEQLGFTGRREGIAAMATATVLLPG